MWFRSLFHSLDRPSSSKTTRRRRPLQGGNGRAADRRGESRQLFLEGLEDRSLMAFNVLGDYATGSSQFDVTLADVNADNRPDMLVANQGGNSIDVRLGNADGSFGAAQPVPTGFGPRSVAVGDFNGDLKTDMVTANGGDVSLLLGNGDGTFQLSLSLSLPPQVAPTNPDPTPLSQSPISVAVGDLNGDGKLDLAVAADTYFSYCPVYCSGAYDGYVNVLIGDGSGGFGAAETHHLGTGLYPTAVAIGDVNGDTKPDVITASSSDLSVLLGNGTGAVGSPINSPTNFGLRSISLGDVDGDGNVDTVAGGLPLNFEKGNGDGTFTAQPLDAGISVNSAVMGDVNHDGKIDLIAAGSTNDFHCTSSGYYGCYSGYYTSTRQVSVILGNGSGGFSPPLVSNLGTEGGYDSLPDVAVADLTRDGLPDLVIDDSVNGAIVAVNDGNWNPPPAIVISDASVVEGNSGTVNAVFTVTLMGAHSGSVSVNYATADNTAVAGADYTAKSGTLTFGPGDSTQTISIPVIGDTLNEFDEQFFVNLSNAVGGVITDSQGIGTIVDDDPAPQLTINDVSKKEGNRGTTSFVFTVSLSAPSGKWVSVNFATADGTAMVSDSDYLATSGNVNFAPGVTTATIIVSVRGDTKKEANETFFVNLSGATNATISDSQGVGTIVNDDGGSSGGGGGGGGGKGKPNSANFDLALLDDTLTTTGKRK
jgi:hypothetical protein